MKKNDPFENKPVEAASEGNAGSEPIEAVSEDIAEGKTIEAASEDIAKDEQIDAASEEATGDEQTEPASDDVAEDEAAADSDSAEESDEPLNNDFMGVSEDSGSTEDALPAKKVKKRWSKKKKTIVFSILGVIVLAIIGIAIYVSILWNNPMSAFNNAADQASASGLPTETQASASTEPSNTAPPSLDPYEELAKKADFTPLKDIVNIMLIGVDHAEERDTWSGKKAFHSDVMIVLAVNTKTNEVNMISLPRDTYAQIPDVKGIYKLNASIDCGGGWPTESGFKKVCAAASWMLGGIPVDYYYAVDMNAVKGLVNAVGGVDYNIDLDFDIQGRSYKTGQMHMDGQAVLDYLRVRKGLGDESGDLNRIDRQKRMLVAIFDKLKQTNIMLQLPDLLKAFDGKYFTNTTFPQTAAFAAFMYKNIDSSKIQMNAMGGTYDSLFNWNFVFTDQKKRVDLIKQVYGVDVEQYTKYTHNAAVSRWASMWKPTVISKAKSTLSKIKSKLDADASLPEYVAPTDGSAAPSTIPKGYKQYGSSVHELYSKASSECSSLESQGGRSALNTIEALQGDIAKLCKKVKVSEPGWRLNYESNSGVNEIKVDFN